MLETLLSFTSNFFATRPHFAINMRSNATSSKKKKHFSLPSTLLQTCQENIGFLQRVFKSVGCNWLISIHVVDFVAW